MEFPSMPGVSDCAGFMVGSHLASPMMWPSASPNSVGTPVEIDFAAQYPACLCPCQRFTCSLNGGPRMTRGQVVCYSFPVGLFHSLSHAGLSRRTRRSSAAEYVFSATCPGKPGCSFPHGECELAYIRAGAGGFADARPILAKQRPEPPLGGFRVPRLHLIGAGKAQREIPTIPRFQPHEDQAHAAGQMARGHCPQIVLVDRPATAAGGSRLAPDAPPGPRVVPAGPQPPRRAVERRSLATWAIDKPVPKIPPAGGGAAVGVRLM